MRGQFAPIRGPYSPIFKQLVRDLLQRDPEFRPPASEVLLKRMPDLLAQFENRLVSATQRIPVKIIKINEIKSLSSKVLYY